MLQVRLHGRGGQGVVTSAELLAAAAFADGSHPQAFPSFGSERSGAPVVAYCRIDDEPIRSHEPIAEPDIVVVQDPTLLHQVAVFDGLRPGGTVLVNTGKTAAELGIAELPGLPRVVTVPASQIAREHIGRPMPGPALLGAFAAVTGAIALPALEAALRERFPGDLGDANAAAARAAHDREVASAAPA